MSRETVHSPVLARHFFVNLPPWIFQPSCCGRSLLTARTESTMANKNNKRKRKRLRREYNCTSHLIRITSRSLSNFTSPGMVDNFSSGVAVNQISIAKTKARFRRRSTHVPNLIDELSPAKERRLNQFGTAVLIRCGNVAVSYTHLTLPTKLEV